MFIKNRMVTILMTIVVILTIGILITACGTKDTTGTTSTSGTSTTPNIVLKYMTWTALDSTLMSDSIWYIHEVERKTAGKIKFDISAPGALGGVKDTLSMIRSKSVDVVDLNPTFFPVEFPLNSILNEECGQFMSNEEVIGVGTKLMFDSGDLSTYLQKEWEKQNIKFLFPHSKGVSFLYSAKKVSAINDLKGLLCRSQGTYLPKLIKQLGMVPVTVAGAEIYDGLLRGVINAVPNNYEMAAHDKFYEVTKYLSYNLGAAFGIPFVINMDTWNSLPKDIRQIMEDTRKDYYAYHLQHMNTTGNIGKEALTKNGMTISDVSKDQDQIYKISNEYIIPQFVTDFTAKGMGKEAQAFIDRWGQLLKDSRAK